ncbi:hypothetical protein HPB52_012034 [Rhipicephalus sanguineus]|uniref:Uncharacterized protein n=1 Tax=Rhipicephalus sanguineus TaxID=34632 RepID=A0A9D4Q0L5_RHISA|nr:hypothetical protein HPB52_012034 [Rhipicephalus sanguineus]
MTVTTQASAVLILVLAATSGEMDPLLREVVNAAAVDEHRVALLCSVENAMQLGKFGENFSFAYTSWTCSNGPCYDSFLKYVAQNNVFARPALVLYLRHDSGPEGFLNDVDRFQKYHANVQWVFPVREHEDLLGRLTLPCQVVTVTAEEINVPHDSYRSCNERRIFRKVDTHLLSGRALPRGTYPKNENITCALFDEPSHNCCSSYEGFYLVHAIVEAYLALNNTVRMWCDRSSKTDSLLMDRQLDVLLGFPPANCYPRCFFYGYAMRAPTSICLARGHLAAQRKPSYPALVLFLVSTFFGRCPPQPVRPGAASATFIAAAWLAGTWLLLNFIQTHITASIAAPEYSPEIRGIYDFAAQLDSGRMLPCTTRSVYNRSKVFDVSVSYLQSLRDALKRCGKECYDRQVWNSCSEKIKSGAYGGVIPCVEPLLTEAYEAGLVPGHDRFMTYLGWSAVHGQFPLRGGGEVVAPS